MAENNAEQVRAFIAVELPQEIKSEIAHLQEKVKRACGYCPARWVAVENIHLTLNFLGDVPMPKLDHVKSAITQACRGFDTFELTLAGLGAFPNLESPRVVWVGLNGNIAELSKIQKYLEHLPRRVGVQP